MRVIGFLLNRLFLLCSLLLLFSGVAAVVIDAARSIGGSEITLAPLNSLLMDIGVYNLIAGDEEVDGLTAIIAERLFHLPAVAVFMGAALLFYMMSYLFKKA